jgi:ABC-type phosphate/phosphonate transport system permease subunit
VPTCGQVDESLAPFWSERGETNNPKKNPIPLCVYGRLIRRVGYVSATPPTFLGFYGQHIQRFERNMVDSPSNSIECCDVGELKSALLFAPLEKYKEKKKLLSFLFHLIFCVLFGLFIGCVLAFVFFFLLLLDA